MPRYFMIASVIYFLFFGAALIALVAAHRYLPDFKLVVYGDTPGAAFHSPIQLIAALSVGSLLGGAIQTALRFAPR